MMNWISFNLIPCLIIIVLKPIDNIFTRSPKINKLSNLSQIAKQKGEELGPLSTKEKIIIWTFLIMLVMWIFTDFFHIEVMTTTLIGLSVFVVTGIIPFDDIISDKKSWSSVITLGVLFSYVTLLPSLGVIDWLNNHIYGFVSGISGPYQFAVLVSAYFFTHYFASGEGTRIIALFPSFYVTGLMLGFDKFVLLMTMAAASTTSNMLMHYTSPMTMVIFSQGYSSITRWTIAGTVMALISLAIILTFGYMS